MIDDDNPIAPAVLLSELFYARFRAPIDPLVLERLAIILATNRDAASLWRLYIARTAAINEGLGGEQ
jgi:hypothetical protein